MAYVQRTGYAGQIGNSIVGAVIGVIIFLVSFPLLFWNEGRAVHRAQQLTQGAASVVSVSADMVDPFRDQKLIHFSGNAAGQTLGDPELSISVDALRLRRDVEMYQYQEHSESKNDTVGGGKTTTYTYSTTWAKDRINSDNFREAGHQNPQPLLPSESWDAAKVNVGAFELNSELVQQINNFQSVPPIVPDRYKDRAFISDSRLYIAHEGATTQPSVSSPAVGDIRIVMQAALPGPVSVIGCQTGSTLKPFPTSAGPLAEMLAVGTVDAPSMFKTAQAENERMTWILRLIGFAAMWIGMALVLSPLKVLAGVIGILGDLVGAGIGLVCGLIAVVLSLTTISIAWIVYRPLVGIGLLIVAAGATYLIIKLRNKAAAARIARAPAV